MENLKKKKTFKKSAQHLLRRTLLALKCTFTNGETKTKMAGFRLDSSGKNEEKFHCMTSFPLKRCPLAGFGLDGGNTPKGI